MLPFFRKQYNIVRYVPRSIAVMSEGKWPGAQTMKHAEHSQARANGVSRLHRDEAGYPAGGVGRDQFCNLGSFSCLMSASGAESFVIYWLLKGWQLERHIASNCLSAWDLLHSFWHTIMLYASFPLVSEFVTWKLEAYRREIEWSLLLVWWPKNARKN